MGFSREARCSSSNPHISPRITNAVLYNRINKTVLLSLQDFVNSYHPKMGNRFLPKFCLRFCNSIKRSSLHNYSVYTPGQHPGEFSFMDSSQDKRLNPFLLPCEWSRLWQTV